MKRLGDVFETKLVDDESGEVSEMTQGYRRLVRGLGGGKRPITVVKKRVPSKATPGKTIKEDSVVEGGVLAGKGVNPHTLKDVRSFYKDAVKHPAADHIANMHDSGEKLATKGGHYASKGLYDLAASHYKDAADHHEVRDHLIHGDHGSAAAHASSMEGESREHVAPATIKHLGIGHTTKK